MKVLVLGATGYVGSRLVPALLHAGHDVVASSSRAPRPDLHSWGEQVEWRRCDATDRPQVDAALAGIDALPISEAEPGTHLRCPDVRRPGRARHGRTARAHGP